MILSSQEVHSNDMGSPHSFTTDSDLDSVPLLVRDYISLGCLCFYPETSSSEEEDIEWRAIDNAASLRSILPDELAFVVRLLTAQWIRLYQSSSISIICLRVYFLPDDARHSTLDRQSRSLRADLGHLCSRLDTSVEAWKGRPRISKTSRFDLWATGVEKSLFWLFNSLPSPYTDTAQIVDRHSRLAADTILDKFDRPAAVAEGSEDDQTEFDAIRDLKATLYSYQARTVAAMIQRETVPSINLDPRYEARTSPNGAIYYFNARDLFFRRSQPQYEGNKGGILAETMGVGKTVIIIALIIATRFHVPQIPPQYSTGAGRRPTVGRLTDMAIKKAGRSGVPLKSHLHVHRYADFPHLEARIDKSPTYYEIPYHMRRSNRKNSVVPPPRKLRLCSTSIIVVPRNLLRQWQAELSKHANLGEGGLRVLVLEKNRDVLPNADEIASYDILLFSKSRFEQEAKDGMDDKVFISHAFCISATKYIPGPQHDKCQSWMPMSIYRCNSNS